MPDEPTARRAALRAAYDANPRAMAVQVARSLGVPEAEYVRAMPPELIVELDVTRWEAIVRAFEPLGNVHVICTNGAVTLETFGTFGNFSTFGDYFNVQTKSLDMHLLPGKLGAIFAVRKPSHMDGVDTLSVQFFDVAGASAFKVFLSFGGKRASDDRLQAFESLIREHRLNETL